MTPDLMDFKDIKQDKWQNNLGQSILFWKILYNKYKACRIICKLKELREIIDKIEP